MRRPTSLAPLGVFLPRLSGSPSRRIQGNYLPLSLVVGSTRAGGVGGTLPLLPRRSDDECSRFSFALCALSLSLVTRFPQRSQPRLFC